MGDKAGGGCHVEGMFPTLKRRCFKGHAMEAPIWLRRKQHDMCFMYTCISHTPCTLLHISLLLSELIHLLVIFLGERRHVISRPTHLFSRLRAWSSCFSNSTLPRGWFESFDFYRPNVLRPVFFLKRFLSRKQVELFFWVYSCFIGAKKTRQQQHIVISPKWR